ncbi:MAG: hypothetical protein GC191_12100 [Azospirillum sp.]|nr:hypothetical protein [Azospirillum sp.]
MAQIDTILASGAAVDKSAFRQYLAAREVATPVEFGGVAGGIVDCSPAFAAALAAADVVLVPAGVWRITQQIVLGYGKTLFGLGDASVIQAREEPWSASDLPAYPSEFDAIELQSGYCRLRDLKIVGGATAVKLFGLQGPCVKNVVENLSIWDAKNGLVLDGYDDPAKPCYWNHCGRILIARPQINGVLLTVESTGDTPNANKFHDVRVYSLAAPLTGSGFEISAGRFNNSFLDCEANLHPTGHACLRLGFSTDGNSIINFYAESSGALPGIRIDGGSQNTTIVNLFSATGGAPIWDTTGARNYTAINAGYPARNLLHDVVVTDLEVEGLTVATEYRDPPGGGLVTPDLKTCHTWLISAFGGAVTFQLPDASSAVGRFCRVKKTDLSTNIVTVTEASGSGPDGRPVLLANRYDWVEVVSNGAAWWIVSAAPGTVPLNSQFVDGVSLFQPDLTRQIYPVSAFSGPVEVRLPAPGAASGRHATIKKVDNSAATVTVTSAAGGGPDNYATTLRNVGDYVTVVSDGAYWYEVAGRYPTPIAGWANPGGSGFNRGEYNSDEISNVGFVYDRDVVNAINYRLLATRDVLRALILDLKMKGILGD